MHPFALSRADDLAKAIAAHARDREVAFIAGGTDLIGLMKDRVVLPERLLDINGLPGMARVELLPDGGLRIGALARMSDVAANAELRRRFPVIADAGSGPWCGVSERSTPCSRWACRSPGGSAPSLRARAERTPARARPISQQ